MNERIDELAWLAGCNQHKMCDPANPDLDGWIISQEKLDKFASLIVEECVTHMASKSLVEGVDGAIISTYEYFGVE